MPVGGLELELDQGTTHAFAVLDRLPYCFGYCIPRTRLPARPDGRATRGRAETQSRYGIHSATVEPCLARPHINRRRPPPPSVR